MHRPGTSAKRQQAAGSGTAVLAGTQPGGRTSPRLSLRKKIVFSFVPLLFIVASLETLLRIHPLYHDSGDTLPGFVVPDKELLWRLRPSKDGPLATNDQGLRDTSYNARADIKALLLGDSVSWGDSIWNLKDVYPFRLEQLLQKELKGKTIEVINSAVPGYSTFQELRYLELYGLNLKPDLIILQFCLNDVVERYSTVAEYGGDDVFLGVDTRQALRGVCGFLFRHSRAFETTMRLLVKKKRNDEAYSVMKLASDYLTPELQEAWSIVLDELEGIRKVASAHHIPLLLVITPYQFQLEQPEQTNQPQRVLLNYAATHQLPLVDLLPMFSRFAKDHPGVELFVDANHFSNTGHALAAATLKEPVRRMLMSN